MAIKGGYSAAVLAAAISLGLVTGPAGGQTLQETLKNVMASHPDVIAAKQEHRAREQEMVQARGGLLPSIDLNAGWGYEYTDSPTTRTAGNHNDEDMTRTEVGVNLRQLLFDGGGTSSEVDRHRARTESARYSVLGTAQKMALETVRVYLDVMRQRKIVALAEENLSKHRRIMDQIKLRSQAGVGRKADLAQIEARVALAESNLVAAKVNLQDAETNYQRVVGELPGELETVPPAEEKIPDSVEQVIERGLANHPVIKAAEADIVATQAQHRAARSNLYPRVEADIGANWNDDLDGVAGHNNDVTAMIRMRYNLFKGGSDIARNKQTAYLVNAAKEVRNNAHRQLVESARLSWASYQATKSQVAYLRKHVQAAVATRDAYSKQFNIGKRTLLDLLNTENEVFSAQKSLVDAEIDNLFAQYRILADE
ncbi:MAG TPA: hypothetical protein EYH03_06780, partial [Chromatiales bacterium]|nr:hypothetical protein [Chromatiales bacterium]